MGTIDDVKLKILAFLMEVEEANAKQLEERAGCANKTFLKARQQLEQQGLIKKRYETRKEGGLKAIYNIPQEKRHMVKIMLEREALKINYNKKVGQASPEELEFFKQKLASLEKELKKYKRLNRIRELEAVDVLPAEAVLKKLEQMGFKRQELCPNFYVEEPSTGCKIRSLGDGDKLSSIAIGSMFDDYKPEDIEIKLIPAESIGKHLCEWENYVPPETAGAWIPLTLKPVKGYYIVGAYKELLQLCKEQFDEEMLEWKEKFELSDEDWAVIGPDVRQIMISGADRVDLDAEIKTYLVNYVATVKADVFERFKNLFMKWGYSEKKAEKLAEKVNVKNQNFKTYWLKWKKESSSLTLEDFASLFRLYQNIDCKSSFTIQLEAFDQWLKKHEKEQLNFKYLNNELRNLIEQDILKMVKKLRHPESI